MNDQLKRALDRALAAATPDAPPPFGDVLARRDRRRRRTRAVVAVGAVAAVTATAVLVAGLGGPGRDDGAPPVATDATTAPSSGPTLEPAPLSYDAPPPLVLGGARGPVAALLSTSCWGNGCFDSFIPDAEDAPDVGRLASLDAAFPVLGQWSITLGDLDGSYGCATYPGLLEPLDDTHFTLTPSGPGGERFAGYFAYAAGGDTSGYWRWTVPERDGVPLAWVALTQNSPSSGGMARLAVVLDDAAVDGDVAATVTVTAADGTRTEIEPAKVDQHCRGDGFVELATPYNYPQRRIDGLGPAPYAYAVDLTLDGQTYHGTGTWSGEHTEHGGDARLTFEPALPSLD